MFPRSVLTGFGVAVALAGGTAARAADCVVDAAGHGDFTTIQAALDAAAPKPGERVRIFIRPGIYHERLTIDRPRLSFVGLGAGPADTMITFDLSARSPRPGGNGEVGTSGSSSVSVNGDDFLACNLTFANGTPDNAGQAVAVKTTADRLIFDRCRFLGFQDTLYPTGGRQYFCDCFITGDTDFIFGNATAVFDRCTINSSDRGFVTAASTRPATAFGFVFLDCTLTASPGVAAGSVYLGRPWQWDRGSRAAVAYIRAKMGSQIAPAGWHPWDATRNVTPEKCTRYVEYGSRDLDGRPLELKDRVAWARRLTEIGAAEYTVERILRGNDGWDPRAVLAAEPKATPPSP